MGEQTMRLYSAEELTSSNEPIWENFNKEAQNGSFFHTLHWKSVFERAFHARPRYFMVVDGEGRVVSLCPFFEYPLQFFRGLMSLPRTGVNHILARDGVLHADLFRAIHAACSDIVGSNNLSFFHVATQSPAISGYIGEYRYLPYPHAGNMMLDITKNPPVRIWDAVFSTKGAQRKYIRQFTKSGVDLRECRTEKDLMQFADYYRQNLSRAGRTSLPEVFFREVWKTCPRSNLRLTMLSHDDVFYGGLLSFLFPPAKTIFMEYLAVNRDIPNKFHSPYMLWWDTVEYAGAKGYTSVCFGGTPADPENVYYRQKKGFGCEFIPSFSYVFPSRPFFHLAYALYCSMKNIY